MSPELTKQLAAMYPEQFRGAQMSIRENLMPFGCECGDGWFELVKRLCARIDELLAENLDIDDFLWVQIKEKFGTLRAYYSSSGSFFEKHASIDDPIYLAVSEAEEESERTCEDCGQPGTLHAYGWWHTVCAACPRRGCPDCAGGNKDASAMEEV